MFKKVLWATDGSDGADHALPLAKALAQESDGELLVFHCVEMMRPAKAEGQIARFVNEKEMRAKVKGQVSELATTGIRASLAETTSAGGVAQAIAGVAAEHEVDVIVTGTRGHTALGGLLIGSVTQRLLHVASCPVLVVPSPAANGD